MLKEHPRRLTILHPNDIVPKSAVEASVDLNQAFEIANDIELIRGHTADPHALRKLGAQQSGISTRSVQIGLPATPRAMRHPKDMGQSGGEVPAVPEIPANFGAPNFSTQEPELLTLLPASIFQPAAGPYSRSASAPPEKLFAQTHQRRTSGAITHSRQNSGDSGGNNITVVSPGANGGINFSRSIDETIRESQVIIIEQPEEAQPEVPPPMLPELQHLAGPLPPPPPPPPMAPSGPHHSPTNSEGVINVLADDQSPRMTPPAEPYRELPPAEARRVTPPAAMPSGEFPRTATPETSGHRRGRGSVSESVGSRLRGIGNRIRDRSASRTRPNISPPVAYSSAPYESLPQPGQMASQRRPSQPNIPKSRTPMPYETPIMSTVNVSGGQSSHDDQQAVQTLLPSTTYTGYRNPKDIARQMREQQDYAQMGANINRQEGAATAPPRSTNQMYQGYRGPREIRANMPPSQFQPGAEL